MGDYTPAFLAAGLPPILGSLFLFTICLYPADEGERLSAVDWVELLNDNYLIYLIYLIWIGLVWLSSELV